MEGMGQSRGGPSSALGIAVAMGALMVVLTALVLMGGGSVGVAGQTTDLPDLVIEEVYNLTEVYQGEDSFFNVTIKNEGSEAYLPRTSGDLEVYGYRDKESEIGGFTKVFRNIYRRENVTINLKVRFDTVGNHTLRVVLDPSHLVEELDDDNNEVTVGVVVVPSTENRPPEANGGNDRVGYLSEPVFFSARYTDDPDGDPLTYSWVFGDGGEGSGRFTNHTYIYEGQYGASLLVSDGDKVDIDSFTVTILEPPLNHAPKAVINVGKTQVMEGEELQMDGNSSFDADKDAIRLDWDFDASNGVDDWIRGSPVTNIWPEAGTYTVTLKVFDGNLADTATVTITVIEAPPPNKKPQANAGPNWEIEAGKSLEIAGEGSDPDGRIVSWEWDVDGDGNYDIYNELDGVLVRTFDEPGVYTLRLRVTDERGATATDSAIVTVNEASGGGNDSPGPAALLAVLALLIAWMTLWNRSKGGSWSCFTYEKDGPSF